MSAAAIASISATTLAIVCATLLGPILAVQAQKWLERARAVKERRLAIFRTLMATRASWLSPTYVEALNAIPIEFYGTKGKLKDINDAWKLFLDHHTGDTTTEVWLQKRIDLSVDLLHLISQYLGYGFSRAQLERDIYSPRAHGQLETEQTLIRQGFLKLLTGEAVLPLAVKEFPATVDEQTFDKQTALIKLLSEWLEGQRVVKVERPKPE